MERGGEERVERIAQRLAEALGEPLTGELRRLSSGASRETFAFATAGHGELVLQIERGGEKVSEAPPQAALLRAAGAAGVPVPAVVASGDGDDVLGRWTIVAALAGTSDPKRILAGGAGAPEPTELLDEIAAALAAVHRMPADGDLAAVIEDPVRLLREWHERLGEPHPTFELAFRALEDGRPALAERKLVHGDFRMGNLMVAPSGLAGVLDWELAHVGDPVEDLGWLCVPAWRFERPDRPAAGLGSREQLLAAYERHSGVAVEPQALRWWELAGTLRWGVICVMQAFAHLSGAVKSIEHAVIGRRACEVEWDLLELMDPRGEGREDPQGERREDPQGEAPETHAAQASGLHDRASAIELLEAAQGTLGDDLLPELAGRQAFQARVTMRALGIVRRELALAPAHAELRSRTLATLGVADEGELSDAIREGRMAGREPELLPALRALVQAKLEVANPAYLEPRAAGVADQPAVEEG